VFIWGLGFKLQNIKNPRCIFQDEKGIIDLKMGYRHGVYIQKGSERAFTWGENTFGQTGN